jgi:hypothetical protein
MKVTGTWEVPLNQPRRFLVTSRDQNSLVLEDTERGRRHKIILETPEDFNNALSWGDGDWWKFIILESQL